MASWDGNYGINSNSDKSFWLTVFWDAFLQSITFFICLTYGSQVSMRFDNYSGPCGGEENFYYPENLYGIEGRTTIIDLICGDSNYIISAEEPIECYYNIQFSLICSDNE